MSDIHLWGVKQNNLKDIEVRVPLESFTVICGPSGSGKSSLAFETLYAEGQRRYIESLSNYTRQFLNKAPKPDVEGVENIPPSIAIEQKNTVKSSRSTVGTTTEVVDYMRLLYEKVGKAYCPDHHIALEKDSPSSATKKILEVFDGERGYVLAPIYSLHRPLPPRKLHDLLIKEGYARIYLPAKEKKLTKASKKKKTKKKAKKTTTKRALRESLELQTYCQVDMGEILELKDPKLIKKGLPAGDFYLVVDRLQFASEDAGRLTDSLAQAYQVSRKFNGHLIHAEATALTTDGQRILLNEAFSCSICNYSLPDISSSLFSFNSPLGACEGCKGFGNILLIDEDKVVPNPLMTLAEGALKPFTMPSAAKDLRELKSFCKKKKIDLHTPWEDMIPRHRKMIWDGTPDFFGVLGLFEYLETKKYKMHVRVFLSRYKSSFTCPSCGGSRLKPEAQQILINKASITDYTSMTVTDLLVTFKALKFGREELKICAEPLRQIISRLQFLESVGVGYLTIDRATKSLSGGEYQRLNLSNQLGVGLSQTLYVLDEPTVGLHPRDNDRLIEVLKQLRDLGNTLVVVEHDHDVISNASHVIEMGPGSGHLGGEILFSGTQFEFMQFPESNTTPYLRKGHLRKDIISPRPVEIDSYRYKLEISGCSGHNLKNTSVAIPLNRIVTVTGVSGSGKSSLVSHTLYPALARRLKLNFLKGLEYKSIKGQEQVKNLMFIDQTPIGKTARSNPVTYLKVYDAIRTIMSSGKLAKQNGYSPGTFSLNVDGGRCPVCKGMGVEVIDMVFMDDIEIPCEACDGKKFRPEILDVTYKSKNIHDILNMTVAEAMDFFVAYPNIRRPLSVLKEVGLEYIRLGQTARSLSGGESQRLKIARQFNSSTQKGTLYIMDEPTTGLHFREVHLLLKVLNRLIEAGGSVLLIEHNLEIIRHSDYVIDMGPEAGAEGGEIVAAGSPLDIIKSKKGYTGRYLKEYVQDFTQTMKPLNKNKGSGARV